MKINFSPTSSTKKTLGYYTFLMFAISYLMAISVVLIEAISWPGAIERYFLIPSGLVWWLAVCLWFIIQVFFKEQFKYERFRTLINFSFLILVSCLVAIVFSVSLGWLSHFEKFLEDTWRVHWGWLNEGLARISLLSAFLLVGSYPQVRGKRVKVSIESNQENVILKVNGQRYSVNLLLLILAFLIILSLLVYVQLTTSRVLQLVFAMVFGLIISSISLLQVTEK